MELTVHESDELVQGVRALKLVISALVAVAAVAAGGSLFFPGLLNGTDVIDGNLRGTAFIILLVALPVTVLAMRSVSRGRPRGLVALTGAVSYLTYQGVMFCFATPFNRLFLAYVALLGLGIWAMITLLLKSRITKFALAVEPAMPVRFASGALAGFALLNALAWLARITPAIITGDPAEGIEGSGLLTSPVWVQDLAFWIPAALVSAYLAWRRHPFGVLLILSMLTFYVLECLSIASDQWWGANADSDHPAIATTSAVPGALVIALLTAVPLLLALQHLSAEQSAAADADLAGIRSN